MGYFSKGLRSALFLSIAGLASIVSADKVGIDFFMVGDYGWV